MSESDVTKPSPLAVKTKIIVTAKEADHTFEQQKELIREANSIVLARLAQKFRNGTDDDESLTRLAKASAIAKQWTVEERSKPPSDEDYDKLPVATLVKAAAT